MLREVYGDIWEMYEQEQAFLIVTTNGYVNKAGECVMGAGIAKQAKDRFPELPRLLGYNITRRGNHVHVFPHRRIITFPVKRIWSEDADLGLIRQSTADLDTEIAALASYYRRFFGCGVPLVSVRPGCGNGNLAWDEVRPVIEEVFVAHNITIVDRQR
jgi:hypothetical protein